MAKMIDYCVEWYQCGFQEDCMPGNKQYIEHEPKCKAYDFAKEVNQNYCKGFIG